MSDELTTIQEKAQALGQVANEAAARSVFADYRARKAKNTIRRQDNDLRLFADFLAEVGLAVGDLTTQGESWTPITWGLVEGFTRWLLQGGYAVSSVNVSLATVKAYAKLAVKAGTLKSSEYAAIRLVSGYRQKEIKRVDEQRAAVDLPTRLGRKKSEPVALTGTQAQGLKGRPNAPQGRRDRLLVCVLLDHGLRCSEAALLKVTDFNLAEKTFTFYRPKVDKTQTHQMSRDTYRAARAYFDHDAPAMGPLFVSTRKGGKLASDGTPGMSGRAITKRIRALGEAQGVEGLSAHDLRHYWATRAARNGTPLDRLQDAGGWSSPAMPLRYVEAAKIANQGVKLDD